MAVETERRATGRKPDLGTHARVLAEHASDPAASYAQIGARAGTTKAMAYRVITAASR